MLGLFMGLIVGLHSYLVELGALGIVIVGLEGQVMAATHIGQQEVTVIGLGDMLVLVTELLIMVGLMEAIVVLV
jgi:hypothetical protein